MSSPLQNNITNLQNVLNTINSLPNAGSNDVELPTLTNPGDASNALLGYEFINSNGAKITGTIPTKTSSDLSASGATVTVPAGYYDSDVTKSVTTITRANTTISTTADDTNDKLTITASNNQSTGYVTGANKTATTTISLTASGATVTASDGSKSISKSVTTATQATPSVSIDSAGKITASATQTAGYVSAGTKTGTKQLTTQAAKTITPSTSSQTAVAKNVYTTGVVTVAAIPSNYEDVTTETTTYTSSLTELEAQISALETALEGKASGGSGGGSVETCTVRVPAAMDIYPDELYYSDGNNITDNKVDVLNMYESTDLTVMKNSIMYIHSNDALELVINGSAEAIETSFNSCCIAIYGDCVLEATNSLPS